MRKLIFEKNPREMNADRNESENDTFTHSSHIENRPFQFVDLRQSIKDKISKSEIFYSFEIVSVRKPKTFYQRFVQQKELKRVTQL